MPANFFNVNSLRGVVFSTPGSGFQVSANAGVAPVRFGNVNPNYPFLFQTFSPQRLFSAIDSSVIDGAFFVPGSNIAATTSAFGAVFVDVDLTNTTPLQFFDTANNALGTFFAAAGPEGLSFLGVQFNAGEQVGRVRITSGNTPLSPTGPDEMTGVNAVVLDDFIYAEPAASSVPEPCTSVLFLTGGTLMIAARRRAPRNSRSVRIVN